MRNTLSCVATVLAVLILIACSLRYGTDIWLLSFIHSLQTHFTLAATALALLALLARRSLFGLALLFALVGLTGHSVMMKREFAGSPLVSGTEQVAALRLMSFNILGNNLENGGRIAEAIAASQADVAFIFEAQPLIPHLDQLSQTYPHRLGCSTGTPTCDLVVLSRHPFITRQITSLSDIRRDRFAMVRIDMGGAAVHLAAAHLTKPYYDDYHSAELNSLTGLLREVDGPLVVAGDFNSSIIAPDMQRFLRATGLKTARYEPKTWPVFAGELGISIDHIFARPPVTFRSVERVDNIGSNHFGLIADLVIRR